KAEVWAALVGEEPLPNWRHRAVLHGFWHPAQLSVTEPYVAAYHEVVADVFARRDGELGREFVEYGYPTLHVSPATAAATERWLAEPRARAAERLVQEGLDTVRRALAARAVDAAAA